MNAKQDLDLGGYFCGFRFFSSYPSLFSFSASSLGQRSTAGPRTLTFTPGASAPLVSFFGAVSPSASQRVLYLPSLSPSTLRQFPTGAASTRSPQASVIPLITISTVPSCRHRPSRSSGLSPLSRPLRGGSPRLGFSQRGSADRDTAPRNHTSTPWRRRSNGIRSDSSATA